MHIIIIECTHVCTALTLILTIRPLQLVAQRIKVKSMDSRMELEAQYGEDMRDTRTIRQKVRNNIDQMVMH